MGFILKFEDISMENLVLVRSVGLFFYNILMRVLLNLELFITREG